MASKAQLRKKVEEVVKPYCTSSWCILKEIACCQHTDPRFYLKLKCVEHLKYDESERTKTDIGWEEAFKKWAEKGYAALFAQFYDEELTAEQIYKKILENIKS